MPFHEVEYVDYHSKKVVPAHWPMADLTPVKIDQLALQTVFLATLFAVAVNIRWKRKPKQ